ncbi:hypothetical protein TVAG_139610 [Trichomonas vaginalis G3]|uniref:Uncharacterized protein n=1 Tax=Trichomonas vaginalis (strain ATCC PRA-98 / G3) TaxID=412133 RepID=A2EJ28_TRIV3|nr:hypothetical protein TVAGG3_0609760 [Trichomonas vaginalis G3]EAY07331.1 hypothetical protein TVAG_139610 [Trichomonas vaginalis G3]KAI5524504.1 hypothetical protein TVAGG3_0609760 [Trichomonas vaginalis G3]|eukprot:XP_001319554.1 hypothetical protein [Trichomonas vaginalis G3]
MFWIFASKSASSDLSNCTEIKFGAFNLPSNYNNFTIQQNELICIQGDYIFSSDKKFKARTLLKGGLGAKSKITDWIENPVAVAGTCHTDARSGLCTEPFTEIMCLEDVCDFNAIWIPRKPTNYSVKGSFNGVEGWDTTHLVAVTISTKTQGEMKLYTYQSIENHTDGHMTGIAFSHIGFIVQDGKPTAKDKPSSKVKSSSYGDGANDISVGPDPVSAIDNDDKYCEIEYSKGGPGKYKLYLQEFQFTLNPEGGLYTKDSPSYEFTTYKAPFHAYCVGCMPCCVLSKADKDAEPEV